MSAAAPCRFCLGDPRVGRIVSTCEDCMGSGRDLAAEARSAAAPAHQGRTCSSCTHWTAPRPGDHDPICAPIDPDSFEPMAMPFEVRECKHPRLVRFERPSTRDGVSVVDGSNYRARLCTGPDFGCSLHSSPPPPAVVGRPPARTRRSQERATLTRTTGWLGKESESFEVRVLARAEGYAMVRRKGGAPFVCSESELTSPPAREDAN